MGLRAWSIIEYHNKPYIIVGFNHRNNHVQLARWLHPVKAEWIRSIMPIDIETTIAIEMISECKTLLAW